MWAYFYKKVRITYEIDEEFSVLESGHIYVHFFYK